MSESNQPGDTETSRTVLIRVSHATHRELRIRVAKEDTSIQRWVEELIERELGLHGASGKKKPSRGS